MVILSGVVILEGIDFSDDGVRPEVGSVGAGSRCFGKLALRVIVIINAGSVLGSAVSALLIERGGIVGVPEYFEQLFVADYGGVKLNADDLCVAGHPGTYGLVGGCRVLPIRIAGFNMLYTRKVLENGFYAPEAAGT